MLTVDISNIVLSSFIPTIFGIIGGVLSSLFFIRRSITSMLQHLVSGIVLGAVAIELLPNILVSSSKWTIAIGFLLGILLILFVHLLSEKLLKQDQSKKIPLGLLVAIAVDFFIDGFLISIAYLSGRSSGLLIAFALSLCAFLLVATLGTRLKKQNTPLPQSIVWSVIVSAAFPLGSYVGVEMIQYFVESISIEILSFGVAALLYLSCEELLKEAHEIKDTPWHQLSFFLGFLLIILFRI